ncbi:invasion associated locus B family protein [Mangrovicoccus algicola]|uniref:Invasion associated locus B family protein n=1 Tax=Mangrovicoccus algicola TaxID=2771008 RepID=A0A8J6YW18_9RHOB|nr:invasion associated locus B family protein [Mangrovicoccus algicola]MBE3637103.1 invasion associated locus B family protein [Mangrovicoccus algicola]
MTIRFGAGLLLSLALATAAAAQETAQPAPAEAPAPDVQDDGTAGLSAGEPVTRERPTSRDQVEQGQLYVPRSQQDWEIRCARAPDGQEDPCQMYQLMRDQSGTPTAEFTLFKIEGSSFAAGALVVTPLETLLPRGVSLSIDGAGAKRYPFKYCSDSGCVSEVGLTAEEVAALKRGVTATLQIVPMVAQNTNVDLTLSLAGFTAAFDGLPARRMAPGPAAQQ